MKKQDIIYYQSLQYLPKIAIQIKHLFRPLQESLTNTNVEIHHHALKNTLSILKIIEKPELKSRFSKEFIRLEHLLQKKQRHLPETLEHDFLEKSIELQEQASRFSNQILQDSFLHHFHAKNQDAQHDEESMTPILQWWLYQDFAFRQAMIQTWLHVLNDIRSSSDIYLNTLSHLAEYHPLKIEQMYNHLAIPGIGESQLISLSIPVKFNKVPKIQISCNGISLHFSEAYKSKQQTQTFDIQLGLVKY